MSNNNTHQLFEFLNHLCTLVYVFHNVLTTILANDQLCSYKQVWPEPVLQ